MNEDIMNEKSNKKAKKILILPIMIVLFAILGGAFFGLLKSGFLYNNGYLVKINDVFGICLEHHYIDATCTEPKKCEICGNTQGVAKGHQWEDATCELAKRCSVCLSVDGEPLGHTVLMGKCDNCNEYQYELFDEFKEISGYCLDGITDISNATSIVTAANASYTYSIYLAGSSSMTYYSSAKKNFTKAYNACGKYEEFSSLKAEIKSQIDAIPTKTPSNDKNSCENFLTDALSCVNTQEAFINYLNDLLGEWNMA